MKLTVIIPTLNEINHIDDLVASVGNIDDTVKEILIVDGGSVDGTRERVLELSQSHRNLKLIDNPDKYVSHGFNKAFATAQGEYISLLGAHSIYPKGYFTECIKAIEEGLCDVCGGFTVHEGRTNTGRAIAAAMSSKFGVGDTAFRTNPTRGYVDSVAFAVYHRKVFEKAGLLDEHLLRNQDDEFHYRLTRAGFRILMLPDLKIKYFVRNSLSGLFKQYFQYGLYKPLVFKKVGSGMRWRHVIPSLFVLYLCSFPLVEVLPRPLEVMWVMPLIIYWCIDYYFIWKERNRLKPNGLLTPFVLPTLHIAYGSGFLAGLWKWRNYKAAK